MSDPSSTTDVLVVGAGPTGLTMACELARHGVGCRIVDKAAIRSDKSKALAVQARTIEVFEDMGVVEQVLARGEKGRAVSVFIDGRLSIRLDLDGIDSPYPFALLLEQSETERILEGHLHGLGLAVERRVEVTAFTQDQEGITVTLRHADGRDEIVRAGWLVGCDGAHSTTRHILGLPFLGARYEEGFILADVHVQWSLPKEEAFGFLATAGFLVCLPIRGSRYRLIAMQPPDREARQDEPTLEEFQTLVNAIVPMKATLGDPVWLTRFRLHRRGVPSYRVGRVFLAGDAAHIHSPAGGQGMNTGIQDAYNLAWKLALAIKGQARPSLLDSYHAERHPVGAKVLRQTDRLFRGVLLKNPVLRHLRNSLLPLITRMPALRSRFRNFIAELSVNYRQSPIVADHGSWRGPKAGDRAPDGKLLTSSTQTPVRLFQILHGTRHTLLLFGGAKLAEDEPRKLGGVGARLENEYADRIAAFLIVCGDRRPSGCDWSGSFFLDCDHSLHRRYGCDAPSLYLIRPDGYVGYRSRLADSDRLFAYLDSIFVSS